MSLLTLYKQSDKITFFACVISILCLLSIINLFAVFYPDLPHQIPLFYSLPWGDSQLASLGQFTILPFIIALTLLLNYTLLWHLHHSQIVLKRFLSVATAIISLLITITAYQIVLIFI